MKEDRPVADPLGPGLPGQEDRQELCLRDHLFDPSGFLPPLHDLRLDVPQTCMASGTGRSTACAIPLTTLPAVSISWRFTRSLRHAKHLNCAITGNRDTTDHRSVGTEPGACDPVWNRSSQTSQVLEDRGPEMEA
jgi:hypothetical protein